MLQCWVLCLVLGMCLVHNSLSQSGEDETEMGSGEPFAVFYSNRSREQEKEPRKAVTLEPESSSDQCSITFHTTQQPVSSSPCSARKDQRVSWEEELSYLNKLAHSNKVLMESLIYTASSEVGEEKYQEVISEAIVGIREDNLKFDGVVKKVLDEFEMQLEGDLDGAQKVKEEYLIVEQMLRSTERIAKKLERASQDLYSSLTKLSDKSLSDKSPSFSFHN
ncbi:hypothetical protein AOXY_G7261 [Acipenser oxyrinchus oxyrinchus]|uniref:Uncharacterized protein n=1 Tax=Acipenser oxyrinchus oxyrinchus TaxID=40147 RepID=A0AAD8G9U8_ACIOX|nr:hypothetical protein AOXY_G7261 [Acipenser oxyrinchus oxyrinchus]